MYSTPRVYLAAPLFSDGECRYNVFVRDQLVTAGYEVYLPQEQGEVAQNRSLEDDRCIFHRHLQALDRAHVVIAICDGPDADSGTSWEAGYAFARGIPVIVLRTDSRMIGRDRRINLMLEQSSHLETSLATLLLHLKNVMPDA